MAVAGRRWWTWPLILLIVGVAAVPLVSYWLTNPADQRLVDLDVYRTGGESVLLGLPVYDVITPAPQLLPFTYPPIAALLATPLAAVSWPVAQWVWTVGVLACLAVTVWYSFRELLARAEHLVRPRLRAWALGVLGGVLTVACMYLMPIRDQVRFGQVDILLVMLCLVDCVARRPGWPRGMLIGLATAVKLTPGVFLIYLLITGFGKDALPEQRKTFFMAVFTTALLTVLPFLVIPHDAAGFWFSALLDSDRVGSNTSTTNQSIRGMLLRLYLPGWLTSVLWLALVAVVAWYGFRHARRALLEGDRMTAVALTGLMAVLLSPVAWIHHLAWMVVALAALAGSRLGTEEKKDASPDEVTKRPRPGEVPEHLTPAGWKRLREVSWLLVPAGVWIYYVLPIPWWGVSLRAAGIPVLSPVAGRIVQDAFGLGAIGVMWLLARRTSGSRATSARTSGSRATSARTSGPGATTGRTAGTEPVASPTPPA
ncbi:glycosyltransferase 87 family protein [Sphaerisporangium sp. NPDC088356]|uniref:glycosyltransferase 87 family protein n=1 Tax=Sphaerisporangium sp. NPDC088356 TaxID=3154871 RepID=UPI0034158DF3